MSTPVASQIAAREALILGAPPRIAPLAPEEIDPAALAGASQLRAAATGDTSPLAAADLPAILRTMLRHPGLYEQVMGLSTFLLGQGALSPRDRELAALRVLWLCQTPFEWPEHVKIAKKVGVTSEEIERITIGSSAPGWSEHDHALILAVEELHERAMICDATWSTLAKQLDDKQLFELTIVVGQFTTVSYIENALRVRLMPNSAGLSAR